MVCGFPCLAISYATSYDTVRIGLSIGAKPKTGRIAFSSYLALFILNLASVVFLCFPLPCIFRKCSFSLASAKLELLNLALQIMPEDADSHQVL